VRSREPGALVVAGDFRLTLTRAGAKKHAAALWLARLCRRAFRSYLLSPEWLNSRAFDDNPFR
jgi:hypothetical protein